MRFHTTHSHPRGHAQHVLNVGDPYVSDNATAFIEKEWIPAFAGMTEGGRMTEDDCVD